MNAIAERIQSIRERMAAAASRSGRRAEDIALVAVSKFHDADQIALAYEAGQRDFGESYAQELKEKAERLAHLKDIRWHFIGNLQRNKVKYVAPHVDLMESVDTLKLAEELAIRAASLGRVIDILLQVNVGGEVQKSGCSADQVREIVDGVARSSSLRLRGLMTLPPFELDADDTRPYFKALRELRDALGGVDRLPHLSMGMSHDFEVAIEEGATIVRVGTAIFGERRPG